MTYIIVFIVLLLFSVAEHQVSGGWRRAMQAVAYVLLVVIAGLRYETGGDWDVYTHLFERIPSLANIHDAGVFDQEYIEPAFLWLCATVKALGGTIQGVFLIITWVNITLLVIGLRRYTPYLLTGMLVYYCLFYFALDMMYTRQSTSVLLAFVALPYAEQWKDIWKYALLIALAALCHRMALVMIPVYLYLRLHLSNTAVVVIVGIGCVMMLTGVEWLKPVYLMVCKWLGPEVYGHTLGYVKNLHYGLARGMSIGFVLNLILLALLLWKREAIEERPYGKTLFAMFVLSLVTYYYGYELLEVSNRFRFYFFISVVALFPMLLEVLEIRFNKMVCTLFVYAYLLAFCRGILFNRAEAVAYQPYQNYVVYRLTEQRSSGKERIQQHKKQAKQERRELQKKNE